VEHWGMFTLRRPADNWSGSGVLEEFGLKRRP
jgi:hypothetical protein